MTELSVDGGPTLEVIGGSITNEYQAQRHGEVHVLRSEWKEKDIVNTVDFVNAVVRISDQNDEKMVGRIVDHTNEEASVKVNVGTFEEDLRMMEPIPGSIEINSLNDREIILAALRGRRGIPAAPTVLPGDVDQNIAQSNVVLTNKTAAGIVRQMQSISGAFVRYTEDGTGQPVLNYKLRPQGETPLFTVGPQAGNVRDEFNLMEDQREDITNVRVLGAGEGDSQIRVEGQVRSTGPNERQQWVQYSNKEITSITQAQQRLDTMIEEYQNASVHRRVETTIFEQNVQLGSPVQVQSDRDGVDELMFVTAIEELLEGDDNEYEVTLSNRIITDSDYDDTLRGKVESLETSVDGANSPIHVNGGRELVTPNQNYRMKFYYTDNIEEPRLNVTLSGLPYRTYSAGISSASATGSTATGRVKRGFSTAQTVAPKNGLIDSSGLETPVKHPVTKETGNSFTGNVVISWSIYNGSGSSFGTDFEVVNDNTGQTLDTTSVLVDDGDSQAHSFTVDENDVSGNDPIKLQYNDIPNKDSSDGPTTSVELQVLATSEHDLSVSGGSGHSHDLQKGSIEYASDLPENCDIYINGNGPVNSQQIGDGSTEFVETVDVRGELSKGAINTIEVSSESVGNLQVFVEGEVFKTVRSDPSNKIDLRMRSSDSDVSFGLAEGGLDVVGS